MPKCKFTNHTSCNHRPELREIRVDYYSEPYAAPGCYKLISKCYRCGRVIRKETRPWESFEVHGI